MLSWDASQPLRVSRERNVEKVLSDGSLSSLYPSLKDQRRGQNGICVRVIERELEGVEKAEPLYRLITNPIAPLEAPAEELAQLYPQRWEVEVALDEFKTTLRGGGVVIRSKTPELVEQEFYGVLLAQLAVRCLMKETIWQKHLDPDRLSVAHSIQVIRRKLAAPPVLSP